MNPVISVLLCTYNERPEFLSKAIHSILRQTFSDFEIILINDGSTKEDCIALLQMVENQDNRIRLYNQNNIGLTKSLNIGLGKCRGKYVCRHDSDDWSEPSRLEEQLMFLENNTNVAVVGCNAMLHMENGKKLWETTQPENNRDILQSMQFMNPFIHGATTYRLQAALAVGKYREAFRVSQDYDFFWRLCQSYAGFNIQKPLYHHRRTVNSISAQSGYEQIKVSKMTIALASMRKSNREENIEIAEKEVEKLMSTRELLSLNAGREADNYLLAGHTSKCLKTLYTNIRSKPFVFRLYLKLIRSILFFFFPFIRKQLFK